MRRISAWVLGAALALPQVAAAQQGERYIPGIWIDPDGCEHWVMDDGAEGYMAREAEMYVGMCWRWRNIAKPTIASVQGKVIAGGLMLVWPMDLVICSEEATFSDPVVAFGVNGHEYFTHPYEAGARLAKEMLFTGRAITAQEALMHGMVNKVVPRDELAAAGLDVWRL